MGFFSFVRLLYVRYGLARTPPAVRRRRRRSWLAKRAELLPLGGTCYILLDHILSGLVVLTDLFFPVGRSRTDQMGWSAHFGRSLLFLYFLKLRYNNFQNIRKLSTMNPDPGLATSDMSEVCIILSGWRCWWLYMSAHYLSGGWCASVGPPSSVPDRRERRKMLGP